MKFENIDLVDALRRIMEDVYKRQVVIMLPFIFFALYEKDGQPAEKILGHVIKSMFLRDKVQMCIRDRRNFVPAR